MSEIDSGLADARTQTVLNIGYQRLCSCPSSHINCLTAKEWIKNQLGVWQFNYEARDIRDKKLHPATYPIGLSSRLISLFTHRGELVVDPFVGSGTTLVSAQDLERNAVGFDLSRNYIDLCEQRLSRHTLSTLSRQLAIVDDARNIPQYLEEQTVSFIITSPPYANLLNRQRKNKSRRGDERKNEQYLRVEQYSQDHRDLGTLEPEDFGISIRGIFSGLLPLLKPKGHCVINVPDVWFDNRRYTLHIIIVEALRDAGYELRNTIIWDRTNIVNRVGIFGWPSNYITMGTTFEYLLDFWRP
ncbi:MAG: DNA methyltransferase [Chloroflexi bacterium]|nr:MAG: DNA methyltransferase [Chloroflexota bacterium]